MTLMSIKHWFLKDNHMFEKKSFKYFIGYDHDDVIRPLCIKLPQMTEYVRSFERNMTKPFNISE